MVQQLAPRHLLEYQVKPVCFLKIFDQLDDVWMALNIYSQFEVIKY